MKRKRLLLAQEVQKLARLIGHKKKERDIERFKTRHPVVESFDIGDGQLIEAGYFVAFRQAAKLFLDEETYRAIHRAACKMKEDGIAKENSTHPT